MKIKEIIVVEGKDDTVAIKRSINADTIETNGSAISPAKIEEIRLAQETRGVIVFTDPDYPGQRIRNIISDNVKGCKHAFVKKADAKPASGKGIGVEHASPKSIREALREAHAMDMDIPEQITQDDLLAAGLIGHARARKRREHLGDLLKIGYTNGKQLHKRLMVFQISREVFAIALKKVLQEELNE